MDKGNIYHWGVCGEGKEVVFWAGQNGQDEILCAVVILMLGMLK